MNTMNNLLDNYYNNKKIKTVFGKTSTFDGELNFKESIKINGTFSGNINASGLIIVGEGAVVRANVKAKTIVVYGTINGDVYAEEKLEMFPSGRVYGNVKTKKIKISDGVVFNGRCEMIK